MSNITPYKNGSLTEVSGGLVARPSTIALALMNAEAMVLVDCSGSMGAEDAGPDSNRARYQMAQEALDNLQQAFPGKIAIVAFAGDQAGLVPDGVLPTPMGDTPMFRAMQEYYPKAISMKQKFVLISDGEPTDNASGCIELARQYQYPIHAIFVGSGRDINGGREFMQRLASISGGEFDFVHVQKIHLLEKHIAGLLNSGGTA